MQAKLAEGLQRAAWNKDLEAQSPGLGDAVLFEDSASGATNAYAVLGNAVMRRLVTKALDLPEQIAFQSVETQARAIESRLKLGKLQDPREVRKLAERHLTVRATEAGAGGASPVASLMAARGITLLA